MNLSQKKRNPSARRSLLQTMKRLQSPANIMVCLAFGTVVVVACGGDESVSPSPPPVYDPPSPQSETCVATNPERPSWCDQTCTGAESMGAFCARMGSKCSITVNGCTYAAVCTEKNTWTGMTTCEMIPDAGTPDAEPPPCVKCLEYIVDPSVGPICSESEPILNAFTACLCERGGSDMPPGCQDVCLDNACTGVVPSAECADCLQNGACAVEFTDCMNDI